MMSHPFTITGTAGMASAYIADDQCLQGVWGFFAGSVYCVYAFRLFRHFLKGSIL